LKGGANVNAVSKFGLTPLIEAAMQCREDIVEVLKSAGASADISARDGRSAADWIADGGLKGYGEKSFRNNPHRRFGPDGVIEADEKAHEAVRKMMSEGLTPEEWCAKHGRNVYVFGYAHERFEDPEVHAFAHNVGEILFTDGLLAECEERFLTGTDLEQARKHRADMERYKVRKAAREKTKCLRRGK